MDQEKRRQDSERLSLRRASRSFSSSIDPRDILNPQSRIILEWNNVGFTPYERSFNPFKRKSAGGTKLLEGVSGYVKPGQILGIMGPTGSGKSLLLSLLAGRLLTGEVEGEVYANGTPRKKDWRYILSFIEQDTGYLDPRLTVKEMIEYTADLTITGSYSDNERKLRIDQIMRVMDIAHIANSTIGGELTKGISGGERKRLCVALELLQEPKVILLDEPTSGLDAKSAVDFMKYIHQLAIIDQLSVIVTIHQPRMSVLSKFSSICLLAEGRSVFFGSIDEALEHFDELGYKCPADMNPAEFFVELLKNPEDTGDEHNGQTLRNLIESWKETYHQPRISVIYDDQDGSSYAKRVGHFKSPWEEFRIINRRYFKSVMRDKPYVISTNVMVLVKNLLIWAVFFQIPDDGFAAVQNRLGALYYYPYNETALAISVAFVFATIPVMRKERYRNMGRSLSYFIMFFVVQLPAWILFGIVYQITDYYINGLRYTPFTAILIMLGLYILGLLQAMAIGIFFAACSTTLSGALIVSSFYAILAMQFSGGPVNTNNITWILRWIRYISVYFYQYLGVVQNEFDGQTLNGEPGSYWTALYALNIVSVMWCAGALMIMCAAWILFGYLVLRWKTRPVLNLGTKPTKHS